MLMHTRGSLGSHDTHEILAYFARKLVVSYTHERAVFEAIEEWWFVPRSTDAVRNSTERVARAIQLFAETGTLILEYQDAYRFATSERNLAFEEKFRDAHHTQAAA